MDSVEQINMERLNRDFRHAIDFESFEADDIDSRLMARQQGLTDAQIKSIPAASLRASDREVSNKETCSVCLNDFKTKDKVRRLPMCTHVFHEKCIDSWLRVARDCPNCKRSAAPEELLAVE